MRRNLKNISVLNFYLILSLLVMSVFLITFTGLAEQRPEITTICMEHITFGKDASKEAIVTWRSKEGNAEGYVKYWPANSDESQAILQANAEIHSYRYARDEVNIYDARLTDLKPNTLYNYKIHCANKESPQYSFFTAPEPDSDIGFTFAVFGDSRGGYDIFGQLMRYAYEAGARFVVFTGDMTDGAVQAEWDHWFTVAADTMPNLPLMPIHGNHEAMSNTYFEQFVLPDDEKNYSFDYGMTHWSIVLDNTEELVEEAKEWLTEDLAASDSTWKFIGTHKPFYSSAKKHDMKSSPAQIYLREVIEEGGVAMSFCGHIHNYERTYPLLKGKKADDGITYVVTGSAGAPPYPIDKVEDFSARAVNTRHFTIYEINPDMIKATAKAINGNIIDEYIAYPRN